MPDISVLVVDDHPVVRQGLRTYLSSRPGLTVVGEAADGEAAVTEAERLQPLQRILDGVGAEDPHDVMAGNRHRGLE